MKKRLPPKKTKDMPLELKPSILALGLMLAFLFFYQSDINPFTFGQSTLVSLEAESMALSGYEIVKNGDKIVLNAGVGQAVLPFPGGSGTYDIFIDAIAEDDAQSTLELWVNGILQQTFTYPLSPSGNQSVVLTGPRLIVNTGEEIKLVGYRVYSSNGTAYARLDRIRFEPADTAPTPTPFTTPTPTPTP